VNRCRRASLAALWVGLAALALPVRAAELEPRPPNIVFLLVDDLRWNVLGHSGYPIQTPAVDRLAAEGVRFENAFVTSSLCSPSRASFLTGVYPHVHGVTGNNVDLDTDRLPLVSTLLHGRGYRTAMLGKWHMGHSPDPRPGYDLWYAMPGQGHYENPVFYHNGVKVEREGYNTDILTEEAVRFIDENRDRPFLLHLGYKAVHEPRTPAARHDGKYANVDWPRRPNATDDVSELRRKDAECLMAVDESVGRIYAALEAAGILDETFFVFTSDNGYLFGEHGRGDKRVFYEESIRIPWIIRYPRLAPAGESRTQMILNIDFVPTLLDLTGVPVPGHVQGESFLPVLANAHAPWRTEWVYEYFREQQWPLMSTLLALRTTRYKYVVFPEGRDLLREFPGTPMLFDLEKDPYEMENVIDDPAHADVRDELAADLDAFMKAPEFRFYPLDPEEIRKRVSNLRKRHTWFDERMTENYPEGWPQAAD
jgi:arylsulfatase A-like enzyme